MEKVWDLSSQSIPQGEKVEEWLHTECPKNLIEGSSNWVFDTLRLGLKKIEDRGVRYQELFYPVCFSDSDIDNFVFLKLLLGEDKLLEEQKQRFICVLGGGS